MVIVVFKIFIFLIIDLLKVFRVSFILRVWMMSVVWAIVSGVLCSDFALLNLHRRFICISKISSNHLLFGIAKMSVGMVRNVWIIKLSYWSFFYKSMVIALIFEVIKIVCFFSMNLIAFKIRKILITLKIKAVSIILLLLMKSKMLNIFWLI